MEAAPHPWPALGVLLMRDGLVEKDELEGILAEQRDTRQQRVSGRRLGEILIQRGRVTPTQVAKLVAEQYELPFVDFDVADIDLRVASVMREDDARRFWAIPVGRSGDGSVVLAIADPSTVLFSDELRRLLGSVPHFVVVGPDAIESAIAYVYSQPLPPVQVAPGPSETADDLIVFPTEDATPLTDVEVTAPYAPTPTHSWPLLGTLLLRDGLVTDADLETALAQQMLAPSLRLGEILTGKGLVTRSAVARLVAEQYELAFYELERVEIDPDVARRLPEELAWRLKAVPIAAYDDGSLQVAIADPTSAVHSDDLQRALGVPLTIVVASPDDIEAALDRVHELPPEPSPEAADDLASELTTEPPADELLEVLEPPHLVVEATVPELAEAPADDDASWATRLALVEDTASDEVGEHVEHDVNELPWEPVAEMVSPLELHAPQVVEAEVVEAEVVELRPEHGDVGLEDESETDGAEVYEFSWPAVPDEDHDEPSLVDELALQVAEAMVTDVVDYDIFGIASRPVVEPATESDDVEEMPDPASVAVASLAPLTEQEQEVPAEEGPTEEEEEVPTEAPVAGFEAVVAGAIEAGASAVHFSPRGDELVVRARIDGLMHDLGAATQDDCDALVARLESEGIARSHVVETSRGPKTTLFVRERSGAPASLDDLALDSDSAALLRGALEHPGGAIVVCGPAGSGTTTTLYALLEAFATPERVVATVEHRVERLLEGVDQVEASPSSGVTFAGTVRELRLTDLDGLLVGDLPDRETAAEVLGLAYEGRIVMAGFHAPSAAAGLLRLADLGVEPTLLASSVGWVVSQRLVRTVCADCRETYYASAEELALLGQPGTGSPRLLVRGTGCETCGGNGFRGRTAIFEVLPVTDDLRGLIADGASPRKLQKAAVSAGMSLLSDEGARLCLDGVTTVSEVARVLGDGL